MSIPPNLPEPEGIDRRTVLKGLGAFFGLGVVSFGVVNALTSRGKEKVDDVLAAQGPAMPQEIVEQTVRTTYEKLIQDHPEIRTNPYLIFTIEEQDVYWFLEKCSFADLHQLGILKGTEQPDVYMDSSGCWEKACERKSGEAIGYKNAALKAPAEQVTLDSLRTNAAQAKISFEKKTSLREMRLESKLRPHITPEVMLAICVQEIAPGEMPGKLKIKPKARLELFRMMTEGGWQPQKMPALFDSAISFGLGQMTLPTHKGLMKAYGEETDEVIPYDFAEHTSPQVQMNEMLLLSYANVHAFTRLTTDTSFLTLFDNAPKEHQGRFITTVLAAYHNYGNRRDLRKRIRAVLAKEYETLEECRVAFIKGLEGLSIAHSHARNSGSLYSYIIHRNNGAPEPALAQDDPGAAEETQEPTPDTPDEMREDTLLVRNRLPGRKEKTQPYYTFTVPELGEIPLEDFMQGILTEKIKVRDVMEFQGVAGYKAGDIIHIPIRYLAPDFQERRMCRVKTNGKSIGESLNRFTKWGDTYINQRVALLYGSTTVELRFPADLCID